MFYYKTREVMLSRSMLGDGRQSLSSRCDAILYLYIYTHTYIYMHAYTA